MGDRTNRALGGLARLAPWLALTTLAVLLAGSASLGQTLWAKVITISGSAGVAAQAPSPSQTPSPTAEPEGQGCSPGFWKQEQHFAEWPEPYQPGEAAADAFGVDELEGDPTLLEALEQGGGQLAAFLRQAVAALLNAAHDGVNFPYSVDEVLARVGDALASGDYEPVKDLFEAANELDCPLPVNEPSPVEESRGEATLIATPAPGAETSTVAALPSETSAAIGSTATPESSTQVPESSEPAGMSGAAPTSGE